MYVTCTAAQSSWKVVLVLLATSVMRTRKLASLNSELVQVRPHKDGSWRLLESTGRVMVDSSGKHVALVSSRDISSRVQKRPAAVAASDTARQPDRPLTERELVTLRLVAQGKTNKQIAEATGVSPYTVKDHLQAAMRKLEARNRVEAAATATRRGLI